MKNSSISCSSSIPFIALFVSLVAVGVGLGEWTLRSYVDGGQALLAKRVAAIYERRVWPVLGDSSLGNVLIGDSQIHTAFYQHPGFFKISLSGESLLMLEILVREYFRFREPGRIVLPVGPQLFGEDRFQFGTFRYDTFFGQNNWIQHKLGIYSYIAEPGIGSNIGEVVAAIADQYRPAWFTPATAGDKPLPAPSDWSKYSAADRKRLAAARALSQRPVKDFERSSHFAAYERMVASLASRTAELCFLRPPLTPEYLDWIENDRQYAAAYEGFHQIAESHAAKYVDFQALKMEYKPEYFVNQDHLNPTGSAIFAPLAFKACFGIP